MITKQVNISPAIAAAVLDVDYTRDCLVIKIYIRYQYLESFKRFWIKITDSKANFSLVDFNSETQANKSI